MNFETYERARAYLAENQDSRPAYKLAIYTCEECHDYAVVYEKRRSCDCGGRLCRSWEWYDEKRRKRCKSGNSRSK